MIEIAVRQLLQSNAQVRAKGAAVYPLRVPENGTTPNVVVTRVSGDHVSSLTAPSGLCNATLQLDFRAYDYDSAKYLADSVRQQLNGFAGAVAGFTVQGAHLVSDEEECEAPEFGDDRPVFRISHDYSVWYAE